MCGWIKVILAWLIFIAGFFSVTQRANAQVSADSLILYLPLNGNTTDLSGNNNNGTVFNVVGGADRFGVPNSAMRFNGIDSYIEVPASPSMNRIQLANEITITAWVNIRQWYNNWNVFAILERYNPNTDAGWGLEANWASGGILFLGDESNAFNWIGCDFAWNLNQWYHIAFSYSKSQGVANFYVDGVNVCSKPYTASINIADTTASFAIGRSWAGPDEYSDGLIDELKVYYRVLSPSEIITENLSIPITISNQPLTQSVCESETALLTVAATGTSNITYQWQKISSEAASLSGLRWTIPSLGPVNPDVDNAIDPATVTTIMGGVTGTNYSVTLRFRGVVETKTYFGGTTNGFWNAGGTPDAFGYNVYELNVSDPPGTYYLNVGSSDLLYCFGIDYQQTITIKAGAIVQLKAQTRDDRILKNKDQFGNPIVIPGIDPSPDPFNGQFIQMDIVAVDGIGYADIADGGGFTGSASTTLSINTSGSFGKGIYRCKVSGDLAEDTYSTAASLVINSVPSAPFVTNNSGCSGTSISLSASGGSIGQYRWYPVATGGTAIASETNNTYITPTLINTTPYYVAINDGSCQSTRTEVTATVIPLPTTPGVQPVNPICPASDIILTATGGTDGQYRWYDGATLIAGQVNGTYTALSLTATKTFHVAIHDGTCESNKTSVTATVQNCTAPVVASTTATAYIEGIVTIDLQELVTDEEDNIDPARLQITMQPTSGAPATLSGFELSINYTGFPLVGEDQVGIEVCDLTDLCSNQQLTIELGGDITVYNGFSPNGDGLNEFFKIQYIDIVPETKGNQVFIYNRWGDEVFSIRDYNNDDRVFKGDSKNGKKLPTGTYFYKVVFSNGKKPMTGFLELKY